MNKLNSFVQKVKYRWDAAPLWIKMIDTTCWVMLFCSLGYITFT